MKKRRKSHASTAKARIDRVFDKPPTAIYHDAIKDLNERILKKQDTLNELNNLVALCRNCHGKKTAMENL